jgi:glycosyltransferase involved in cell wall biosynthesis
MSRLSAGLAWRWRRLLRPLAPAARAARSVPRRLRERRECAAFERTISRLATESATRPASVEASVRLLAIGTWTFPDYSQSFVYQELAALAGAGFDVRLAASAAGPDEALAPGVKRLAAGLLFLPGGARSGRAALDWFRRTRPGRVGAVLDELAASSRTRPDEVERDPHVLRAFAFARLAEAFDADWIHSYFFYEGALAAGVASRLLGRPRGATAYSDHVLADYRWKRVREQLEAAELIVATSRRARGELAALAPAAAARILVKPNSVDTSYFRGPGAPEPPPGAPFRLLAVCRIDPKKGLPDLVAAVAALAARGARIALEIVGDVTSGDLAGVASARELDSAIDRLGVADHVVRRGFLPAPEVCQALRAAHLFVAPYLETATGDKDGIPTAVLEAMACGVPVLATRAGAIPEAIVDGESGVLVPPSEPDALAAAIERLLADPTLRRRLAAAARERVDAEFSVERCEPALAVAIAERARAARSRRTEAGHAEGVR